MTKSKVFHFEAEKKCLLYAINFKPSSTTKTARQVLSIISSTVRNCAEIPGDVAIPKTAEFKIITKIMKYSKNESASPST